MSYAPLCIFFSQIIFQSGWIKLLKSRRAVQVQKAYGPNRDASKAYTPSFGGVVFVLALPVFWLGSYLWGGGLNMGRELYIWSLPICAGAVGFCDDALKLYRRSSEGLRSMQKFWLQIALTLPWCVFAALDLQLWEGFVLPFWAALPLLIFIVTGFQNAVNVTDGLDCLLAGAMAISFCAAIILTPSDMAPYAAAGLSICAAFMWHNAHPAAIFMGDTGAHFLAGLLLAICAASGKFILILPLGFLYGVEIISVAIQIVAIRKFGKKIFKMSPLHHHFEKLGWAETRIVTRFWLIHAVGMAFLLILFKGVIL